MLRNARAATTSFFVLNGFILGMWVVHIPEILERTDTSKSQLGALLLLMGGSALAGMQAAGRLTDRFGSRPVLAVSAVAMALALPQLAWATNTTQLAMIVGSLGLLNGFFDVTQNAQAVVVERLYDRPIMSAFHAFFSLGGVAAASLGGFLISRQTDLRFTLATAAAVATITALGARRLLIRTDPRKPAPSESAQSAPKTWSSRVLILGLLAFVLMLSEGVAYDWSTVHLNESLGASKGLAAWGFGLFSLTMTAVRLLADRIVTRVGPGSYVRGGAFLGATSLLLAALSPTPGLAIVAWAIFGVGLAGCVPQFFTAAGNIDPASAGAYLAKVTGFGYIGLLAGPASIGLLTEWVPLTAAFAVPIIGCVLAGSLAPRALRKAS